MSFFAKFKQDVVASTLNSSTSNLDKLAYLAWVIGTTYAINDLTTNGGSSWKSILDANTGNTPTTNSGGTLTAASPGVLTIAGQTTQYANGTPVQFTGITSVVGISNNTTYYLQRSAGGSPNWTYTVRTTPAGADINTTGSTDTGIIYTYPWWIPYTADTFTGASETTLGIAGIQVMLKTDQDCYVWVDQSNDEINWDVRDRFDFYTQIDNFGITVQAVGAYFRVRVVNQSTTTSTTFFRVGTALCPIVEAVPRNLTREGNLKISVPDYTFYGDLTTINNTIVIPFEGHNSSSFTVSGTWTGTLVVEGSGDDQVSWHQVWISQIGNDPIYAGIPLTQYSITSTGTNVNGEYRIFNTTGLTHIRVRASTVMTGTATVHLTVVGAVPNFMFTHGSMIQSIYADPNNSSVVALLASATYAGTATSTLGVAGLQVSLKTDQNCTIYTDQSSGTGTGIGTVTTNGTTALAGSSTKFLRDLNIGDQIWVTGETVRVIDSISSDTALTVSSAFSTSTGSLAFTQHFWDISDDYNYYADTNFGITVQAIGAYVRARVVNSTAINTTYFRLQTVLCPIVEAVPRTLDENGHLQTAVHSIKDEYGWGVENTPMGEMRTVVPTRLVGAAFDGGQVDANFWTSTVANNGTASQANAQVVLATNTTANGSVKFYSTRVARYVSGSSMCFRGQIQLSAGNANNKRRWGIARFFNYTFTVTAANATVGATYTNNGQTFTVLATITGTTTLTTYGTGAPLASGTLTKTSGTGDATITFSVAALQTVVTDGAYFELDGTTLSIVTNKASSEARVSSGSFNGNLGLTHSLDTSIESYEIYWTNGSVYFIIDDEILHKVTASSETWSASMSNNIYLDNVNSSGESGNHTLSCRVASIRRLGPLVTQPTSRYLTGAATTVLKYGPGNLHSIVIGDNSGTVILYDNTAGSGTIITSLNPSASGTYNYSGLPFYIGLTAVVTGAPLSTVIYE